MPKTPYKPEILPPKSLDTGALLRPAVEASAELAKYDSLLSTLPNPNIIVLSLLREEATLSSKIEGTQATFDEVLRHDAGMKDKTKHDDFQEIINYRETLENGRESLDGGYKISMPLVRAWHKTLMDSVRGKDKSPGQVRLTQNHIGKLGSTIENATFVPPAPEQLPPHLDNWIAYINNTKQEAIIQAALMHAQFELLHPFMDGNGRLGRILIPLFLYQKEIISIPAFYISAYLESNRDEYYRRLQNISKKGDWMGWVRFFLKAVTAQCKTNSKRIKEIKNLHEDMQQKVQEVTHSQFTLNILNAMFTNPYCNVANFVDSGIPAPSAYNLTKKLEQHEILEPISSSSGRRAKIYAFLPLLDILIKNR